MSLYFPLMALQGNDAIFNLNVTFNGDPLNLTPYTPKLYKKATQQTPDGSAILYQVGSGLTMVNAALGKLRWTVPHADLATAGVQWWRLDLVDTNGGVSTVFYGPFTIKAV